MFSDNGGGDYMDVYRVFILVWLVGGLAWLATMLTGIQGVLETGTTTCFKPDHDEVKR